MAVVKGKVKDLVTKHDASRIVQTVRGALCGRTRATDTSAPPSWPPCEAAGFQCLHRIYICELSLCLLQAYESLQDILSKQRQI